MSDTDTVAFHIAEALSRLIGPAWGACCSCSESNSSRRRQRHRLNQPQRKRTRVQSKSIPGSIVCSRTTLPEGQLRQPSINEPTGNRLAQDEECSWPEGTASRMPALENNAAECRSTVRSIGGGIAETKLSCRRNCSAGKGSKLENGGAGISSLNSIDCSTDYDSKFIDSTDLEGEDLGTLSGEKIVVDSKRISVDTSNSRICIRGSTGNGSLAEHGMISHHAMPTGAPTVWTKFIKEDSGINTRAAALIVEARRGISCPGGAEAAKASPIEVIGQVPLPQSSPFFQQLILVTLNSILFIISPTTFFESDFA